MNLVIFKYTDIIHVDAIDLYILFCLQRGTSDLIVMVISTSLVTCLDDTNENRGIKRKVGHLV